TADPKHIPFAMLIGQPPTQFPLPPSILEKQNTPGAGGGNMPATTPAPTPAKGDKGEGAEEEEVVVTITSTVPEGFTTMTVTRSAAEKTPAAKPRSIPLRRRHRV